MSPVFGLQATLPLAVVSWLRVYVRMYVRFRFEGGIPARRDVAMGIVIFLVGLVMGRLNR